MSEQSWKSDDSDDVQMPLGMGSGGGEAGSDSYGTDKPKGKINGSTLALIIAFAAALGMIYLLGLQNKPRMASADHTKLAKDIDAMIKQNDPKKAATASRETNRLVIICETIFNPKANKNYRELPNNPFEDDFYLRKNLPTPAPPVDPIPGDNPPVKPEPTEYVPDISDLKLQMIVAGSNPTVLINGRMISVGGKIDGFTVTAIESTRVLLNYGKHNFELKLNKKEKP